MSRTVISPRSSRGLVALLLVFACLALPMGAGAQSAEDKRKDVQKQKAAVAAQLDALRATDAQVDSALATLNQNVANQTSRLRSAERKVAEAEAALAAAEAAVTAKVAEIGALEQRLTDLAIAAYVNPTSGDLMEALGSETISEAVVKREVLEAKAESDTDILDQLTRAREDLEFARDAAVQAEAAAQQHRGEVAVQLDEVETARNQQAQLAVSVQARLDHKLSEAASLATLDKQLSEQIAREAAARARATASAPRSSGGGSVAIVGSGSIVSVNGIRVHRSIAENIRGLLNAAAADGIRLHGGGYRDPNDQIRVRRNNCGTSNYDVYHKPASHCRPPTARPGQSMHERGLAIDFTYNGRIIGSRSSPAFRWLKANAARYGMYNLPSEPWHWSVNGR